MFDASPRTLKRLAALLWYSGVIILLFKSTALFIQAEQLQPDQLWIWLAVIGGLLLGAIKANYLFKRICIRNLRRIDALPQPQIWHFYRIQFFIFLFLMVTLGGYLSRLAQGDYTLLLVVAAIELSIATALLGSSGCFRRAPSS
jgi:hypothetical protein